jgi:tetratricopeptide (TPR) repeat protein
VSTFARIRARLKGKGRLLMAAVLVLATAGVGAYLAWRPRTPVVPTFATEGLDAEVAATIDKARAAVEARPDSAAAWGRLGMILFAQDMYVDCTGSLAEAERLDPTDARWPYFRGLALLRQKPEEGIVLLERAARLAPHQFSLRLRLAEEYARLQRIDEADALFSALLAEHPDNPRVLLGCGQALLHRGRWQEAMAPLQMAAEHPTARRSARVALAEAYLRLGDPAAAEAERRRLADVPGDVVWPDTVLAEAQTLRTGLQPRIDRAFALRDSGQIGEALSLLALVLRDHPDSDEAHLTLAKVLIQARRFDAAEVELDRALALNPNLVDGHFLLAGIRKERQDYAAAERGYLRTIALKSAHGLAYYNLGVCRRELGRKAEAIDAFRAAVRCRPDLAAAHLELGALLLQDNKVEDAIECLNRAVRLDGKNERARRLLEQARGKEKTSTAESNP